MSEEPLQLTPEAAPVPGLDALGAGGDVGVVMQHAAPEAAPDAAADAQEHTVQGTPGHETAEEDPLARARRENEELRQQLADVEAARAEAVAARQAAEERLQEAEAYIYDLQQAVMVAEIAAEEGVAEAEAKALASREELEKYIQKLFVSYEKIEEMRVQAETDPLTGLANRTALDNALPRAEADAAQEIIAFDANGFGKINKIEEYGQKEGDIQLRRVANAIRLAAVGFGVSARMVFRRGGDEFVVIVPARQVEYITRNADGERVSEGFMSLADAVIRRAAELYRHRRYSGTYGTQMEPLTTVVSLSGAVGQTFNDADSQLQAAKMATKEKLGG